MGFLEENRTGGACKISLKIGRSYFSDNLFYIFTVTCSLRNTGGAILASTGSHSVGVDLIVADMVRIASLS